MAALFYPTLVCRMEKLVVVPCSSHQQKIPIQICKNLYVDFFLMQLPQLMELGKLKISLPVTNHETSLTVLGGNRALTNLARPGPTRGSPARAKSPRQVLGYT